MAPPGAVTTLFASSLAQAHMAAQRPAHTRSALTAPHSLATHHHHHHHHDTHAFPTSLLTGVALEEYPLLGLFSRMLLETGAGSMDRVELTRHIGTQTGGVYCGAMTSTRLGQGGVIAPPSNIVSYLFLR
jgi:Peptidase M16C associated